MKLNSLFKHRRDFDWILDLSGDFIRFQSTPHIQPMWFIDRGNLLFAAKVECKQFRMRNENWA